MDCVLSTVCLSTLDEYQIISHFQNLYSGKLVVYSSDDTTIYIVNHDFFDGYPEKSCPCTNVPRRGRYINCELDGAPYIVERTEHLLN